MSKKPSRKSFIQYELPPKALEKVQGGRATTMATGEEGGERFTTLALGEEGGGTVTTLAIGEEGGCGGTY